MKKVIVFTGSERVIHAFSSIEKSRSIDFEIRSGKARVPVREKALCYLDVSGLKQEEIEKKLADFTERKQPWGIVDPDHSIDDVGVLFHRGACDYFALKDGKKLKVRRIQQVYDYYIGREGLAVKPKELKQTARKIVRKPPAEYSGSWSNVKSGKTYTFCIMYVELIPSQEVKGKSGSDYKEQMQSSFENLISQQIKPYDGKIWMWDDWGGLVLFPYDGQKCDTIFMAMRLVLNRVLYSIESGPFTSILSFRLALHVGMTSYKTRGQTGTIVSDDINFIFHLGKKKIEPGYLYLTDNGLPMVGGQLRDLFRDQGIFEEHRIYRMTSPYGIYK